MPSKLVPCRAVPYIDRVREYLGADKVAAYLVGGVVRDLLLGRELHDIDLAVDRDPVRTVTDLRERLGGYLVPLDEERGVIRLVLPGKDFYFDICRLRGSIEEDLRQRDFTIDALALDLYSEKLIDPLGGEADLKAGIIRAVGPDVFHHDPGRLLRAARLAAELGFTIEPQTSQLILDHRELVLHVSKERIREEVLRILSLRQGHRGVQLLEALGLLTLVFPELETCRGVTQPPEHFGDVFTHSLETVKAVEFVLHEGEGWGEETLSLVPWSPYLERHFTQPIAGFPRSSLVKLAGLLHDIAKPQCRCYDEKGRLRFLGHQKVGAEMAEERLRRLRFSQRECRLVSSMIRHHLRPTQMSHEGLPTRRAVYRFFRDTGEVGIDTLFLSLADHLATRGPYLEGEGWEVHCRQTAFILEEHCRQLSETRPSRLLDGHDIMREFGLSPGPLVGKLLEAVGEAQAAGEVKTRGEALELVRRLLQNES